MTVQRRNSLTAKSLKISTLTRVNSKRSLERRESLKSQPPDQLDDILIIKGIR